MTPDVRLYVLVDANVAATRDLAGLAVAAVDGGATLIQLRDKTADTRVFVHRAQAIREALLDRQAAFVINDRVDVALACGADGVHLGQNDMHADDARRLLGPDAIIGLTIKNAGHVASAPLRTVDYLAVGGVFATASKDNPDAPIGLDGLVQLSGAIRSRGFGGPVCAIAGITRSHVDDVIAAGVDGVCVVSAVISASDPQRAADDLRAAVDAALLMREQDA